MSFLKKVAINIFALLPTKKKIAFINFFGRGYGDNPKYIAEEILHQKLPYDLVWLVYHMDEAFPQGIRKVKYHSLRFHYELATSRIIICNAKGRLPYKKKKSQYYIQTWHGGFPLKYIEKEAEKDLDPNYVLDSQYDSSLTDLILSGSEFQTKIIENSFWYSGEIFKKGIPRNDIFFNQTADSICNIKKKYGFSEHCKIVLYAPTFRDNNETNAYCLNAKRVLGTLSASTGKEWIFIIRLHPNAAYQRNIFEYSDNIIDGTTYADPQELLLISDILITDYSSMMIDFGIMERPVFLFIPDLEDYKSKCRGLRPIFNDLPFDKCQSEDELLSSLEEFNEGNYKKKLDSFMTNHYQSYDDGQASKHIVDRIIMKMEGISQ